MDEERMFKFTMGLMGSVIETEQMLVLGDNAGADEKARKLEDIAQMCLRELGTPDTSEERELYTKCKEDMMYALYVQGLAYFMKEDDPDPEKLM